MPIATVPLTYPKALYLPRYEFECAGCEAVELRHTPDLPKGWTLVAGVDSPLCKCADCAPRRGARR